MNMQPIPFPDRRELDRLGGEIEKELQDFAPKGRSVTSNATPIPMPRYVEHMEGTSDMGKLTSAGLATEYEAAAVKIEAMGKQLMQALAEDERVTLEMVRECERVRGDTEVAVAQCAAAAQAYRDEAKAIFERIQNSSNLANEVRELCEVVVKKIPGAG